MKNNNTFGFFSFRKNLFVLKQISFKQKFLFFCGLLLTLLISPSIIVSFVIIISFIDHDIKKVLSSFDELFSYLMCILTFKMVIKKNYKLAWYSPLDECDVGFSEWSEKTLEYWNRRQDVINKLKKIEDL
jgi:hypothetical protein